jgi:hypothetical protein
MKKLKYFAGFCLIAMLTACSATDDVRDGAGAAMQSGEDSPASGVPVVLSVASGSTNSEVTRSPLASGTTAKHNFETPDGQYLGIFALAQTNTPAGGATGSVPTANIKWDGSVENARLLWNQPAKADSTNQWQGQVLQDYYTAIHLLDPASLGGTPTEVTPTYPLNSWYNYYFYAYYPRVADTSIHESNNVVTADYSLDGSKDIITGIAKPATNPNNGYCGKYFRTIRESGNGSLSQSDVPQLALTHHLAQLRFFVRSKNQAYGPFKVKDITLLEVPSEWSLIVADKSNDNNRGTLSPRTAGTTDMPVREMTIDSNTSNIMTSASDEPYDGSTDPSLTTTPKLAGYAMVPTTAMINAYNTTYNREFTYQVQLTIQSNDVDTLLTRTITTNTTFEPSHVYNIIIKIDQSSIESGIDPGVDFRAVDLGLPSGIRWASVNIGAETETERGLMFTWGCTTGYSSVNPPTDNQSFVINTDPLYKYTKPQRWKKYGPDAKTRLEATDDAAVQHTDWGYGWRMPTLAEYQELLANTTHEWVANYEGSGVSGMLFTSTIAGHTDKSIFMPVAGYRTGTSFADYSTAGYYWSSDLYASTGFYNAYRLMFNSSSVSADNNSYSSRWLGLLIRPVLPAGKTGLAPSQP